MYAAIFIDAIMVKVRDGQVGKRPVYAAIGVDLDGHKDSQTRWAVRWKPALNAFAVTFGDRMPAAEER